MATSADATVPAVKGTNTGTPTPGIAGPAVGLEGESNAGWGVYGHSKTGRGVVAESEFDYGLRAASTKSAGIRGSSVDGRGVEGWAIKSEGVVGISTSGNGVWGQSEETGTGVLGTSNAGYGVAGRSQKSAGVRGDSADHVGVEGGSTNAYGVAGASEKSAGVRGTSVAGRGVEGWSTNSEGSFGLGRTGGYFEGSFEGVHAISHHPVAAGVAGYNDSTGPAIYGKNTGGGAAAYFDGDLVVTGVIHLAKADYAEDFTASSMEGVEPGAVMVLDDIGGVTLSQHAYDKRVAGLVSGAGDYKPAVILDHDDSRPNRLPLALMGKAFCMVDATDAPIEIGDLLTTSSCPGHAMKATDPLRAWGAIIGKALQPLASGRGLIPVLVRLQ